jgi:hypothetical protein
MAKKIQKIKWKKVNKSLKWRNLTPKQKVLWGLFVSL